MRLIRYYDGKRESYGVLSDDNKALICLPSLAKSMGKRLPRSLEAFLRMEEKAVKTAEELLKKHSKTTSRKLIAVNRIKPLAPIVHPPKIICLGLNYRDHAAEQNAKIPDEPIIFLKPHTTIIGPYENIIKPKMVKKSTMRQN